MYNLHMTLTRDDLDTLMTEEESLTLEFKRGDAFSRRADKADIVKECIGFANAGGGGIVYGVAERRVGDRVVADTLAPVVDEGANLTWLSEVLRSKTMPPFAQIELSSLDVEGGRVVVVDVHQASTAHQSLHDHKYYARAGAVTAPMSDFQIRDVMSRRHRPEVLVRVPLERFAEEGALHRFKLGIDIENTGTVSLEYWALEVDVPHMLVRDSDDLTPMANDVRFREVARGVRVGDLQIMRISLGDPYPGGRALVHPRQTLRLRGELEGLLPNIWLKSEERQRSLLSSRNCPLRWRMYLRDAEPHEGEIPFNVWCNS